MSQINKVTGRDYKVLRERNAVVGNVWDKLSFWTDASDVEFSSSSGGGTVQSRLGGIKGITTSTTTSTTGYAADASVLASLHQKVTQSVTAYLATGETTLTFNNSAFGNDTIFDIYTDKYGVNPTSVTLSGTLLTVVFKAQSTGVSVRVHFWNP